jgi:hypothetical protein
MQHRLETLGPGAMGHATPLTMEHDKRGLGGGRPAKGSAKPPRGGRKRDTSAMGNMMARLSLSLSLSLSLTLARMTPTLALALALT